MSSPNQRIIYIHHTPPSQTSYLRINHKSLYKAYEMLQTTQAIALYIYLCDNADTSASKKFTHLELSSADFCNKFHISHPTYLKAFDELVNKGYLQQIEGTKTKYNFYELPSQYNI